MTRFDERYATSGFYYGSAPNDFLREHYRTIPAGGAVLSIGEGEGRNAVFLAERGYRVLAIDESAVGLDKARRLAAERGVRIDTQVCDVAEFEFAAGRWDGIVSIWCHLPRATRARVHGRIATSLAVDGAFLLECYRPAQLGFGTGGPKSLDLLPALADLREELLGLDLLHAHEGERDVHEGIGHTGRGAVVQVVARPATRTAR